MSSQHASYTKMIGTNVNNKMLLFPYCLFGLALAFIPVLGQLVFVEIGELLRHDPPKHKPQNLPLIRKFIRRMKDAKRKIANGQIF